MGFVLTRLHLYHYIPTRKLNNNVDKLSRQAWKKNVEDLVEDDFLPEEGDVGNLT